MGSRTLSKGFAAARSEPDPRPVAVTRWTARLADPHVESNYRLSRFSDDRRRAILLALLVTFGNGLNGLGDFYALWHGAPMLAVLLRPVATITIPVLGLLVLLRVRTPPVLETVLVAAAVASTTIRMIMLTLHPDLIAMWPAWMIATLFVIYLYLPMRLVVSVALAATFSLVAPVWWSLLQHPFLPPDQILRGFLWLLVANALGFTAANSLQRSQRMQFAQSLVLKQLLSTDSLTGIANRRRFDDALEREWRRCARAGAPLSLLIIDVDHFKAYNDRCGHQQGDECLRRVARLLLDGVGRPGDLVARYGGEEFVCLLPEISQAGARAVATRLIAALHRAAIPHPASPLGPRLTISIGAASILDLSDHRPAALLALADKLLYAAKNAGRNQFVLGQLDDRRAAARAA
jgi:diguanylate cyclase (GGDEF)-like protein